jgi:hypothetical protein
LYIDDNTASLVPLVLTWDISGDVDDDESHSVFFSATINSSADTDCDVLFQSENENLRMSFASHNELTHYNELFNRTGAVDRLPLTRRPVPFVVVLIPKLTGAVSRRLSTIANLSSLEGVSSELAPTRFLDFQGSLNFTVNRSTGQILQSLTLPLKGRLCCSLMTTDRQELTFEDCELNQTYVRDFSVWNRL